MDEIMTVYFLKKVHVRWTQNLDHNLQTYPGISNKKCEGKTLNIFKLHN